MAIWVGTTSQERIQRLGCLNQPVSPMTKDQAATLRPRIRPARRVGGMGTYQWDFTDQKSGAQMCPLRSCVPAFPESEDVASAIDGEGGAGDEARLQEAHHGLGHVLGLAVA